MSKLDNYPLGNKSLDDKSKAVVKKLVAQFIFIEQERMQGIPIVNKALKVQAIGFTHWEEHFIGILITPWFMNLMLLPKQGEDWSNLEPSSREEHIFPAKSCTFIVNELEDFGFYKSHPLHSPMFNFDNQQDAVDVAESFLQNLLDDNVEFEEVLGHEEIGKIMIAAAVKHADDKNSTAAEEPEEERAPLSERLEKPISRRELLRGSFLS